ncbi:GHMP kinase [Mangrovimonas sp. AS39]|uniref:GYDIA family GHMP kinase n=1 Tax=Mangrovimonas futianensis TaxID=2895523 RepID=UPI001E2B46F8|nr:GYDIA family GHMP kinase [Mangrovimonas futianensis]MCF1190860.1 GHMP kinase [Mangrovimonas futianensis]MCF1194557.1 GHMP kinase [Mangrovimonas futianensis]
MKQAFYSNGKLLLSGEYVVLDGALSLAFPTKYGQSLTVSPLDEDFVTWRSFDENNLCWLEVQLPLHLKADGSSPLEERLIQILKATRTLNPDFLSQGALIETKLDFPRNWGLGTSSTLINNIAQWAEINPFKLLNFTFGGSGYDIACAQTNSPILYQIKDQQPSFEPVPFNPSFKEHLYFVFLNQKQNSREGIKKYHQSKENTQQTISEINDITQQMASSQDLESFSHLMNAHENLISKVIQMPTIKTKSFPDFEGSIKSLGAWGGDFILVASPKNPTTYFKQKGFEIIIPFKDMIL